MVETEFQQHLCLRRRLNANKQKKKKKTEKKQARNEEKII